MIFDILPKKYFIFTLLFFLLFIFPHTSNASVVLNDSFTGTTLDTNKWIEYDAGGIGGTVGNVQQSGILSITGDGTWNHNGIKSVQTFDRSKGDVTVEGDWQLKNSCASDYSAPSVGVMYGDMINGFNQEDGALSLIYYGGSFRLFNASGTFVLDTQVSCVPNTTIHYKFVVKQAGGVDVYLNGSLTPNGSLSAADAPNSYTNKPISLQQKIGATNPTITIDNIVVTISDVPAIPTGLAATPSAGQVALNWTAPNGNGSTLTDYKIEYKLTSEPTVWTTFSHIASTSTSSIVDGLLNGVSYDFRVSGVNGIGTGSPSNPISSTPNLYVPGAPSSLISNFGPNNHINLSWTTPLSNGGASITDYLVEYKLSTEPTVWTTFVDGVSTSTSATATGLTSGLNYDFRVSAINSVGAGSASNTTTKKAGAYLLYDEFTGTGIDTNKWTEYDSAIGGSGGTAGKVQQNGSLNIVGTFAWNTNALKSVQTFDRSSGDITIEGDWIINDCSSGLGENSAISFGNWVTNGDVVSGSLFLKYANGAFKLFYWPSAVTSAVSCTSGVPTHIKEVIKQAGGTDVYLNNSDTATLSLSAGQDPNTWNNEPIVLQQYYNTGASFDNITVSNSGYTIPGKTAGLTATPRDSQMELSWTAPADGGSAVIDYLIQYKLSSEPTIWTTFAHTPSSSTTNFVTGLTNGTSYDFRVSAVNINGNGTASDVVTATPIQSAPSAPQNLSAGNTVSNQIDLTWGTPVSNGGASITNYLVEYKLASEPTVWTTFVHGASTATSISVTSLTNGLSYDFRVSAINSSGTGTSSSVVTKSTVNSTPSAPVSSSVSVTGQSHTSEYLLGSYVYSDPNADPEGVTTFRWMSSSTLGGTYSPISGATSINYTVAEGDLNNYLKLEVTPVSTIIPFTGTPVLSNAIGPITAANYLYHILSTGQSLSLGYAGSPVLSTTQPYSNKMLDGTDSTPGTNLVPLVEASNETPAAAMGNGITFQNGFQTVVTRHGVGGTAYSGLKKGTAPYVNGMQQMVNVRNAATAIGETSQVMGITAVHGETDDVSGNSPYYEGYLAEWQHDYETDIKAINGQVGTIPLFTDQMDSWTTYGYATSAMPEAELAASEDYPGKIILVGPKYFLTYNTGPHLTNTSYRLLGEYYAKVMKKVFFDKVAWRPLSPDSTQIIGNEIYAKFHVPAGVLTFDTDLVKQNTNYGFEYYDSTSSATINSVSIINSDTVKITLSNVPTGSNQRLRYAYTGVIDSPAGAQSEGAPRGNLRDTDPTISLSGNNLYDWSVHFDKAITAVTDVSAPVITQVNSNPSDVDVSLSWQTDELASSFVDYGLTSNYGTTTTEIDLLPRVINHNVTLSNLVACTTYHYRVLSIDEYTNQATGSDRIFTTTGCTGGSSIVDQNSSNITSQSGGTVNLNSGGNSITLVVPPSFSLNNADFQIKQLNKSETLGTTSVPTGYLTIGSYVYDLKALSDNSTAITSFDNPLTITLSYTSSDVIGMNESSLKIYRWDGSVWTSLTNCSVDTNLKTVTCNTNHFSVFSLFGQVSQAPHISSGGGGGSGSSIIYGCTDRLALNYQTSVMSNPALCKYPIKQNIIAVTSGCKDLNALNYDSLAINSDISLCKYSTIKKSIESNFTRDLKLGSEGSDVKLLQEYLNSHGFIIAKNGAGSKGREVEKFGPATKAALIRFQKSKGITPANGYFGPKTRKFVSK